MNARGSARQNDRVDRAAASKVGIAKPPDPRLRVQRVVMPRIGIRKGFYRCVASVAARTRPA